MSAHQRHVTSQHTALRANTHETTVIRVHIFSASIGDDDGSGGVPLLGRVW